MLSAVIQTQDDPGHLVQTLGSLVPAVAEGVVRDGFVLCESEKSDLEAVADAAGCTLVCAKPGEAVRQAVRLARGDYLVFLPAGCVLESGWWVEAAGFMQKSRIGAAPGHAAFSWASPGWGVRARLAELARRGAVRLTGRASPAQGMIVSKAIAMRSAANGRLAFPPVASGRPALLRARAFVASEA